MTGTRARATALPADERRAAIVDAALALVLEHGVMVTTKQIAEAAGIAEGTIFRVFDDKAELLDTVVEAVLDPAPDVAALAAIDADAPLEVRLVAAVEVFQRRVERIWQVMTAVGLAKATSRDGTPARRPDPPEVAALAALIGDDDATLRCTALEAAQVLRNLTFATTHPALVLDRPATAPEIVSLLLDGIRRR